MGAAVASGAPPLKFMIMPRTIKCQASWPKHVRGLTKFGLNLTLLETPLANKSRSPKAPEHGGLRATLYIKERFFFFYIYSLSSLLLSPPPPLSSFLAEFMN